MHLRFGLPLALSALSFVGCSAIGINDGSLDYKKSTVQAPLQLPEGAKIRPATPLYPAPVIEQLAIENAPDLTNKRGNRYELPRPNQIEKNIAISSETEQNSSIGLPQLLNDGNGNPLIKIDGNSATIWQYTIATLSSLNHSIVGQSKNTNQVTLKVNGTTLVLKLSSIGSTHTLAVYNPNNTFADKQKSADLLTQIYQNWPA